MPKVKQRLLDGKVDAVNYLWKKKYTMEEIAKIFQLSVNTIYQIIKRSHPIK